MSIEIEKKYVLTGKEFEQMSKNLRKEAEFVGQDFEENILYGGGIISENNAVLRLRKIKGKNFLTFKKRVENKADIKHQIEYETMIEDADQAEKIIESLGFKKCLIYEKRRKTWRLNDVEIVLDELPFGLFMEIEGSVKAIEEAEKLIGAANFKTEHKTYPQLTVKFGTKKNKLIKARFD